jgi:hypothetical protein
MLRQREHSQNLNAISSTTSLSPSSPGGSVVAGKIGDTGPIGVEATDVEPTKFESFDPAKSDREQIGCSDEETFITPAPLDEIPCCCDAED